MPQSIEITGLPELQRKLAYLGDKAARRVVSAAVGAGLTVIAKEMRRQVNATSASTAMKREARATIGKRFVRSGRGGPRAIAGFGVGKKKAVAKRITKAVTKRQERILSGKSKRRGVGISAANIHWAVLGTKARQTKSGKATGAMPAIFKGVIDRTVAASQGPAGAVAVAKMKQRLEIEARKKV